MIAKGAENIGPPGRRSPLGGETGRAKIARGRSLSDTSRFSPQLRHLSSTPQIGRALVHGQFLDFPT